MSPIHGIPAYDVQTVLLLLKENKGAITLRVKKDSKKIKGNLNGKLRH